MHGCRRFGSTGPKRTPRRISKIVSRVKSSQAPVEDQAVLSAGEGPDSLVFRGLVLRWPSAEPTDGRKGLYWGGEGRQLWREVHPGEVRESKLAMRPARAFAAPCFGPQPFRDE